MARRRRLSRLIMMVLALTMLLTSLVPALATGEGSSKPESYVQLVTSDNGILAGAQVDFGLGILNRNEGKVAQVKDQDGQPLVLASFKTDGKGYVDLSSIVKNDDNGYGQIYVEQEGLVSSPAFISLEALEGQLKGQGLVEDSFSIIYDIVLTFKLADGELEDLETASKDQLGFVDAFARNADDQVYIRDSLAALLVYDTRLIPLSLKLVAKDENGRDVPVTGASFSLGRAGSDEKETRTTDEYGQVSFSVYPGDLKLEVEGDKIKLTSPYYLKQDTSAEGLQVHQDRIPIQGTFDKNNRLISNDDRLTMSYRTGLVLFMGENLVGLDLGLRNEKIEVQSQPAKIKRIQGDNRYLTAVELAKEAYKDGAKAVVVASGGQLADALAAGPLAIDMDAPILLVGDRLTKNVEDEIKRLGAQQIIIVGGPSSVSKDIEEELKGFGGVLRLAGANRYDTSVTIAEYLGAKKLILANGINPVDALAVSAYAGKNDLAILLTSPDKIADGPWDYILSKRVNHVEIVGGPKAVGPGIEEGLGAKFQGRIAGADRYETATKLAQASYASLDEAIIVSGGSGLVDALAAGPYAFKSQAPILLTSRDQLAAASKAYLVEEKPQEMTIVGGYSSVGKVIEDELAEVVED